MELKPIKLPSDVDSIIKALNENGYTAYVVGGCVRDFIMGIEPHDWDITTDATPDQVESLFADTIPTGKVYGTITVICHREDGMDSNAYEITTFRADGTYSDGRRPDKVNFGKSIVDDLSRRDFTVNAIAYNPLVGYVDPFDGIKDIENKVIRAVGDPQKRLQEDALRVLRGVRFAFKYGFEIEQSTLNVINNCYGLLDNVSKERVHSELLKILEFCVDKEDMLIKCHHIFEYVFELKLYDYTIVKGLADNQDIEFRIFKTLLPYKKLYEAEIWLRKYKFDNKTVKRILKFYYISKYIELNKENIVRNPQYQFKYIAFKYGLQNVSIYVRNKPEHFVKDNELVETFIEVLSQEPCEICNLEINGWDLRNTFGRVFDNNGELIGKILNECVLMVIANPKINNSVSLKHLAKELLEQWGYLDGNN